jgi:energy-coupling factor transporter ATP-binding protein EcfA2
LAPVAGREMRISDFRIRNFRGITDTSIALSDDCPGNVVTLIGLNESGKTTILEALSHFVTEETETATLVGTVQQKTKIQDLIPKDKKAAFTGVISVTANATLDDTDVEGLSRHLRSHGLDVNESTVPRSISVERAYRFVDSELKDTNSFWAGLNFSAKTRQARIYRTITHAGNTRDTWLKAVSYLRERLPSIVYFPTLLFNFPDRIYLEGAEKDEINSYYVRVIQDVLDCQGDGLSISRHIVDRIKRLREGFPTPATFLAHLIGLDEKSQIDAVLQKASNEMSKVVFSAWGDILGRQISNKRVQIDWSLDTDKGNAPYLQLSIIDRDQSRYALSERSLGFRWFFSFLLFTEFRKARNTKRPVVFLFDEPAANLHSKAQMKLLESFSKIADAETYIIYSTHSHYMVNPLWLEKAYIVDNRAIDYDDEDEIDSFAVRRTDIHAIRYRTFVGSHPTKTTYFQPVLDALEVSFSPLERASKALIVEGKYDYHPAVFLRHQTTSQKQPLIFPANGAGDIGCLVGLFRGWGVDFRILLDDDRAGRDGKKRYIEEYLLPNDHVMTLGEISQKLAGKTFEGLYATDVVAAVGEMFGVSKPKKRQFSLFFQDLLARGVTTGFSKTAREFQPISKWIDQTFGLDEDTNQSRARRVPKAQKK